MAGLFDIAGKTALVTGGSRGIGLMIARGYVEAGAKVYISSRRADVCDQVAAELSASGTCVSLPADVSSEAGARQLAAAITGRESALHVLVNNAGANWGAPLAEYPDAAWDKVLALNVKAIFHLTRTLLPALERAARPGDPARVINIGSIDGLQAPFLETYAYSASKAAVHHLTRVLAHQLASRGVTVNTISPGYVDTDMVRAIKPEVLHSIVTSIPMGRLARPEEIAGLVAYLASDDAGYITGANISINGGLHME